MLEYLLLLAGLLRTLTRVHGDLVAENLLLRQQLAILTRPTRKRSSLRTPDRLFWVLVRLVRGDWRRHLVCGSRTSAPAPVRRHRVPIATPVKRPAAPSPAAPAGGRAPGVLAPLAIRAGLRRRSVRVV